MIEKIKNITRKPLFWVLFVAIFGISVFFSIKYFSTAFPIVNVDIKMNRTQALEEAKKLAQKFNLGPQDFCQAASFKVDNATKIFVELEAGGKEAFVKMMKDNLYMPYSWVVRHFKEKEKNEAYIKFQPDGKPYGFIEIISEDKKGAKLSTEAAQNIAVKTATKTWKINLDQYKLVESSKVERPSTRIDHTFVYERTDKQIGKGFYQIKIVVSGDKVTQLSHFVKIPDNFFKKYSQMRSANESLAGAASLLVKLLYLLCGCLIGLFFLFKKGYVIWKAPVVAGILVAFGLFLESINKLPLAWMGYNTATSAYSFLFNYLIRAFMSFLYMMILYTISFMAAEGLTRVAFGDHIQFWKNWSKNNANSITVLGKTIAGYFLVGINIAIVIATYLFATKYLGWWIPSDEIVDPNVIANYFPWVTSITRSLGAGFWEECLFRAIPLAGAAIIGQRYGKRNLFIVIAMILQAIIFGAAHANYAAQPAYARLVELIIPSLIFGGVYLKFGLLVGIITHFTYDVVFFGLPVFIASYPGAWINKLIIILLTLIPLFIVLFACLRKRKLSEVKQKDLNASWSPPEQIESRKTYPKIIRKLFCFKPLVTILILALGIAGTSSWIYFTKFTHDATALNVTQNQAIQIAKKALTENGIKLSASWQALPLLAAKPNKLSYKFIWQSDQALYKKFLGSFLDNPRWVVRFVTFQGTVSQRSEEYRVFIDTNGRVFRIWHRIPEDRKGENLSEEKARIIAHGQLAQKFKLDPKKLKEVSAESEKKPDRKTWLFTFANEKIYPLKQGQARIAIKIDGNEVTDAYRYIKVPEKWERGEINKQSLRAILKTISYLLVLLLLTLAFIFASKGAYVFAKRAALFFAITLFLILTSSIGNKFLSLIAQFSPNKPFINQLFNKFSSIIISLIFTIGIISMIIGLVVRWKNKTFMKKDSITIAIGISLGIILMGMKALIYFWQPALNPLWPEFPIANYFTPFAVITKNLVNYALFTAIGILLAAAIDSIATIFQNRKIILYLILPILFIIAGISITGIYEIESIAFWLLSGTIIGIALLISYITVIRFDISFVPILVGIYFITEALEQAMFKAFNSSFISFVITAAIIFVLSIVWFKKLNKD